MKLRVQRYDYTVKLQRERAGGLEIRKRQPSHLTLTVLFRRNAEINC